MSIQTDLELALEHHKLGRLSEAEAGYRAVLAQQDDQPDALHLLGLLALQTSRADAAVQLIGRAVKLNPGAANYYVGLINALGAAGRVEEMIVIAQYALVMQPNSAEANCNLADALFRGGRGEDAIAIYQKSVRISPSSLRAWNNLGIAYSSLGKKSEATESFKQAIALKADFAEAHYHIAKIQLEQGDVSGAIAHFQQATAAKPDWAEAWDNLGVALNRNGELNQAIDAHRRAILANPKYAAAYSNLGVALTQGNHLDVAIESLRLAVALTPDLAVGHNNLGNALRLVGLVDEACNSYLKAMELSPGDAAIHSNYIYALLYRDGAGVEQIRAEENRWNERHGKPLAHLIQVHENDRDPDRRLRIGYVSGDFRDHVAGRNLLPLLWQRDREAVEVFCYSNNPRDDSMTEVFKTAADFRRDIASLDDAAAAERIRDDRIDILLDLSLHSARNRLPLFARKPAPVQASFVGYPGSTGVDAIDYRISDPYLDAEEGVRIVRLPNSFWCYDAEAMNAPADPISQLPASEAGHVTFGSLGNFCKINDAVVDVWAKVMNRVARSRLIVLIASDASRVRLLERLRKGGIDSARVECVDRLAREDYFKVYNRIDIGMDTYPYNGHTTSLDSFWMGVPVVALVGESGVGRAGWSQLSNLNLKDLAAQTPGQFVQIAAGLAGDLDRLANIRGGLRERMKRSPICNSVQFARDVEAAYREIWRRYCSRGSAI